MSRPISYTSAVTVNPSSYLSNLQSGAISVTTTGTTSVSQGLNSSDNTSTYAQFTGTTQNSDGYAYYKFDVGNIPQNATINSVVCTARGRAGNNNRGTTGFQLCNGTTTKGNETTFTTTTSSAYTLTTGTWTVSELSDINLRIRLRRTSNNTFLSRFYGATLTVNYSVSGTEYEVSFNNQSSDVTTSPSTTQYIMQGGSEEIRFYDIDNLNGVEIKDNGTDIKNSLVTHPTGTFSETLNPAVYEGGNGTVTNQNNALTDTASTTYSQLLLRQNVYMIYGFDVTIPENAVINSVGCVAKYQRSVTSSSINNLTIQMYSDTTAKGDTYTITSTSTAVSTANLTVGTWTVSELKKVKIRLSGNYTGSNSYYLNFYGANLTINYTINEVYYTYTISNISTDHTILIEDAQSECTYIKQNGNWVKLEAVYKKIGGSWTIQSDLSTVFTDGTVYVND